MPAEEIRVHVVSFKSRYLYMRYRDPRTGRMVTRSTKCHRRKDALKAAGVWQDELRNGKFKPASKITWTEFRKRYEAEVLPGLADTTGLKIIGVFDAVDRILSPGLLSSVTSERVSFFVKTLRSEPSEVTEKIIIAGVDGQKRVEKRKKPVVITRAESTIKGILATLKAALNWAHGQDMLREVPKIDMPKRAKGGKVMKGRPITAEEFERMLAAVDGAPGIAAADVDAWKFFLRGLWWSGLRLEESLNLHWSTDTGLSVDLSGRRPMLRIPGEYEKGNQDRLLPMAPEFAEFLLAVPQADRTGLVFKLPVTRKDSISKLVSGVGARAGVKVNTDARTGKVKFASAHDLRRSFGERWASRIMPQVLMQLMRHESIETTLRFYVGQNAERAADVLWAAVEGSTPRTEPGAAPQAPACITGDGA